MTILKKVVTFIAKKIKYRVTAPSDTNLSDATDETVTK